MESAPFNKNNKVAFVRNLKKILKVTEVYIYAATVLSGNGVWSMSPWSTRMDVLARCWLYEDGRPVWSGLAWLCWAELGDPSLRGVGGQKVVPITPTNMKGSKKQGNAKKETRGDSPNKTTSKDEVLCRQVLLG